MRFILDPVAIPGIICLYQAYGMEVLELVFYMTRTYAYGIHRRKQILIGNWPYAVHNQDLTTRHRTGSNSFLFAGPSSDSRLDVRASSRVDQLYNLRQNSSSSKNKLVRPNTPTILIENNGPYDCLGMDSECHLALVNADLVQHVCDGCVLGGQCGVIDSGVSGHVAASP